MGTIFEKENIKAMLDDGTIFEIAVIDNHSIPEIQLNSQGCSQYKFLRFENLKEFDNFVKSFRNSCTALATDYNGNCYEVMINTDALELVYKTINFEDCKRVKFLDPNEFKQFKSGIKSLHDRFEILIRKACANKK